MIQKNFLKGNIFRDIPKLLSKGGKCLWEQFKKLTLTLPFIDFMSFFWKHKKLFIERLLAFKSKKTLESDLFLVYNLPEMGKNTKHMIITMEEAAYFKQYAYLPGRYQN